jgi:hypothetical protein
MSYTSELRVTTACLALADKQYARCVFCLILRSSLLLLVSIITFSAWKFHENDSTVNWDGNQIDLK